MKAMQAFVIWLLMALVPLQGAAANALLVCKAANGAPAVSYVAPAEDMHAHPCAGMQASQDDAHQQHAPDKQTSGTDCIADYAGVPWMPAGELALPSSHPLPDVITYAGFRLPNFIPDGPERPPRTHSL
ncbi:hypothetical protein [Noviherbaspirillum sp.]|uniref:hypothetical protein n=1 Tax=Noviherbaspirillum sp. TaxID=1926288 RepID=UPI002D648E9A|nr:hypothetical protein [Noviherbaspirillum sp.]HZW20655.1 hypothetical protein [Noviherbaspirillum sp.]